MSHSPVTTPPVDPVRYSPAVEQVSADEQVAVDALKASFKTIMDTTSRDYGRAVRGVHAKGHALVHGTLTVAYGLPPALAQGLFAQPGRYPAMLRLSTVPGDILDDAVSSARGAALKISGVTGAPLPGATRGEQDFLMVNGPVFGAKTPAAFAKNLKLLAATTDKAEGLKKAWSATLRTLEAGLEALGGHSMLLTALGGAPETHPLGETYFTTTAFRFGDYIAKLSLRPAAPALSARSGEIIKLHGRADALREEIGQVIAAERTRWDLCVQLCTDLEAMPVEDPTVEWDQAVSPYLTVATFEADPQVSWDTGSDAEEDAQYFSPWNGLAAHQPLGAVNRARQDVYAYGQGYRADFNHCPIQGARSAEGVQG
jgi:catalase